MEKVQVMRRNYDVVEILSEIVTWILCSQIPTREALLLYSCSSYEQSQETREFKV